MLIILAEKRISAFVKHYCTILYLFRREDLKYILTRQYIEMQS